MSKDIRTSLITELIELISKGNAHVTFEDAVAGLPKNLRTKIPENLPYSIWQLVEHVRITQKDILDFSFSSNYTELKWPQEYWTPVVSAVEDDEWEHALAEIKENREQFLDKLKDNKNDLFQPFEWGTGQSLVREAMLIADHNSYHTAEIIVIRRLLKAWK